MTTQFNGRIAEIHDAMRRGDDALALQLIHRLNQDTIGARPEAVTPLVEEIAPLLRGLSGTFSKLAVLAGAFVERGASPLALAETLPETAVETMARHVALLQLWPEAADGRPLPEFRSPLDEATLDDVEGTLVSYARQRGYAEREVLRIAHSWFSIDDWIRPLISCMVKAAFRAAMRWREQVRDGAVALMEHSSRARWLYGLCLVRDDEPLIVLDPTSGRGFQLTMSGIGDNFQLHTLLADRLIAPEHGGVLKDARPPEPAWVEAAGTGTPGPFDAAAPITRRLRLFDGHGTYIAPEGWPADIEPLDGTRVLLLHPPRGDYGWINGRCYVGMTPTLTLDCELSPAEAAAWLSRTAPARETDLMGPGNA